MKRKFPQFVVDVVGFYADNGLMAHPGRAGDTIGAWGVWRNRGQRRQESGGPAVAAI